MPYTKDQCAAFAAKAARGEKVPSDWKEHCTKSEQRKAERRKGDRRKSRERRSHASKLYGATS